MHSNLKKPLKDYVLTGKNAIVTIDEDEDEDEDEGPQNTKMRLF